MTGSTSSPWKQLRDLAADTAALQAMWARGVVDSARAASRGESADARELLQSLGSIYESWLRDLAALNLRYAKALQDLAAESGRRVGDAVGAASGRDDSRVVRRDPPAWAATSSAGPVVAALPLRGVLGASADGSFSVANTRDQPAVLRFEVGRLVDPSVRGSGVRPDVAFQPDEVRLGPGEETQIAVRVTLDADRFVSGHDYLGRVEVVGGDGTALDLSVRVEPPEPARPPQRSGPAKKAAATKTAKKAAAKKPAKKSAATKAAASETTATTSAAAGPGPAAPTTPGPPGSGPA